MNLKLFGFGMMVGSIIFLVVLSFIATLTEINFIVAMIIMIVGLILLFSGYARQIRKYGIKGD